jgi:hypothetical protein
MRAATLTQKRVLGLFGALIVVVCLFCLARPTIQYLTHYAIRFVDGQHPFGGAPIHDATHIPLPSVVVEPGSALCCRMELCDFRFPLPKRAGVATIDSVSGGGDTIKGAVYVTNADGSMIDLLAYSSLVHRAGFRVTFVPAYGDYFSASSPDGGLLQVSGGQTTKIAFSFFGDF